eukprot:232475-Chlamydomonas_euryale.AAC.1
MGPTCKEKKPPLTAKTCANLPRSQHAPTRLGVSTRDEGPPTRPALRMVVPPAATGAVRHPGHATGA